MGNVHLTYGMEGRFLPPTEWLTSATVLALSIRGSSAVGEKIKICFPPFFWGVGLAKELHAVPVQCRGILYSQKKAPTFVWGKIFLYSHGCHLWFSLYSGRTEGGTLCSPVTMFQDRLGGSQPNVRRVAESFLLLYSCCVNSWNKKWDFF